MKNKLLILFILCVAGAPLLASHNNDDIEEQFQLMLFEVTGVGQGPLPADDPNFFPGREPVVLSPVMEENEKNAVVCITGSNGKEVKVTPEEYSLLFGMTPHDANKDGIVKVSVPCYDAEDFVLRKKKKLVIQLQRQISQGVLDGGNQNESSNEDTCNEEENRCGRQSKVLVDPYRGNSFL